MAAFKGFRRANRERIEALRGLHSGGRCFVVATGSSLNRTDFSRIRGEVIFGVNRLYRGFAKFGINCAYYAVCDGFVWANHFRDILGLDTTLFLSGTTREQYLSNLRFYRQFQRHRPVLLRVAGPMRDADTFSRDLREGLYDGISVITDVCLQACHHMGFSEVYLLGCDCDRPGLHFDGLVFRAAAGQVGTPVHWKRANLFRGYAIAKQVYEADGRHLLNATVGGKLKVLRRVNLSDIPPLDDDNVNHDQVCPPSADCQHHCQ